MKKTSAWIIILIILSVAAFSADDTRFRLVWTVRDTPVTYEGSYMANNIGINTDLAAVFDFGGYAIEAVALCDYISVNGHDASNLLVGAILNAGGTINMRFIPLPWLEIKTGIGGLWQKSSFQYNNSGWLGVSQPGITGMLDLRFIPWEFMEIDVLNRLDMILSYNDNGSFSTVLPNYNAGLRATFRPGIRWLGVFIEGDAFFWNYASAVRSVSSLVLKAQVGCTLDIGFDGSNNGMSPVIQEPKNTPLIGQPATATADGDKEAESSERITDEEPLDPALIAFARLKPGSEVTFTGIVFEEGNDTLTKESLTVLDKIAGILNDKKSATILVSAYGLYSGDLMKDSAFVKNRANAIRKYLSTKGVDTARVKVSASGFVSYTDEKTAIRPKVKLKILS